ncbi:helix-turn-helix domain-containing protein [Lactobacillus paragasseri]|uniref:Helix-turn-helix domain-containing protein n=1 Tax=Lactobacillus paragasseri TaxID=2107999 RepID=A0ABD4ZZA4_9LACO|nr:helix-turn-helix domain-containing protein [Lactobacillus paragasseri]MDK7952178.1 helix-turn-helix domain-containing protein [Lactobacillus paragasseri]MDO6360832.1 helix-turn-helix domain-containing protein [Lactobacillus paragasseri]
MQVAIPEKIVIKAIQQQYFNKTEAANFLGVSLPTFRAWLTKYDLKPISVDGQILYDREVLKKFMKGHQL